MTHFATLLITALLTVAGNATADDRLIVHEWGTFTNFAGSDGVHFDFRPLIGEDLPSFVHTTRKPGVGLRHLIGHKADCKCKACRLSSLRMETPVLYFYSKRERVVSVKVGFPQGRVTEWFPQARSVGKGIDWGEVRVMPTAKPTFPTDGSHGHYYPARETDASPLRVVGQQGTEFEKFLFYRGIGDFAMPLRLRALGGGRFALDNRGTQPIRSLFLVRIDKGTLWFSTYDKAPVANGKALKLPARPSNRAALARAMTLALQRAGLYQKEARAMVKSWKDSWFGEQGTRLLYLLPETLTEKLLPLEINQLSPVEVSPAPLKTVRVLVGRLEILTPEQEQSIEALIGKLNAPDFNTREQATAALAKLGRFAEGALQRIARSTQDAEVRARTARLLRVLNRMP